MAKLTDSTTLPERDGPVIEVTAAMEKAGPEESFDLGVADSAYTMCSIYRDMILERLDADGEL